MTSQTIEQTKDQLEYMQYSLKIKQLNNILFDYDNDITCDDDEESIICAIQACLEACNSILYMVNYSYYAYNYYFNNHRHIKPSADTELYDYKKITIEQNTPENKLAEIAKQVKDLTLLDQISEHQNCEYVCERAIIHNPTVSKKILKKMENKLKTKL